MRHDPENVKAVAELAIEYKELIIGFDIAGPELIAVRTSLWG